MDPRVLRGPVTWDISPPDLPENNGCVFRKSVWRKFPFDESLEAAEDKLWSYQILNAGYTIAESAALYKYCYQDPFWAALRRFTRVQVCMYRMRGKAANPYPARRVLVQLLYRIPLWALRSAFYSASCWWIYQTVPWRARRKPRLGSVK
jgi:hypothetical protein